MGTKNKAKSSSFVVLYFETDGCTDPEIKTAPVDLDTARAKLKELWGADLKEKGYSMPKVDEFGGLCSKYAYLRADCEEATTKPYAGAKYEHKWLVLALPAK